MAHVSEAGEAQNIHWGSVVLEKLWLFRQKRYNHIFSKHLVVESSAESFFGTKLTPRNVDTCTYKRMFLLN